MKIAYYKLFQTCPKGRVLVATRTTLEAAIDYLNHFPGCFYHAVFLNEVMK